MAVNNLPEHLIETCAAYQRDMALIHLDTPPGDTREARLAEATAARLAAEQQALDRKLAAPGAFGGRRAALEDALKRRAELARLIEEAEAEWFAAESAIEQMNGVEPALSRR